MPTNRFSRRQVLELSSVLGAANLLGCSGQSAARGSIVPAPGPAFPKSILHATRAEFDAPLTVVAGEVPTDMAGHVFAIGAVPEGGGVPPFTGDGMILRLSFEGGKALGKTRLVRTDDFYVDQASAHDPDLAFKSVAFARLSTSFGGRNFANTALTPVGDGRLLASYDAGRPWEIDAVSLDVLSPVGHLDIYQAMLPYTTPAFNFFPLQMGTAHPCFDAGDGTVYLINFGPPIDGLDVTPFVRLVRWDRKRPPTTTQVVGEDGSPVVIRQSCHQMQITKRFVVLSDGAFNVEPEQMEGLDISRPQASVTTLYVIRKSDITAGGQVRAKKLELPIESAHFLVDQNDDGDRLTVMLAHQNAADPSEWVRANDVIYPSGAPVDPDTVGMIVAPCDLTLLGRYTFDLTTGRVVPGTEKRLIDSRLWTTTLWTQDVRTPHAGIGTAFWSSLGFMPSLLTKRMTDMYADYPYRIVPMADLPTDALPGRVHRIDLDGMVIGESFAMPMGHLPMSPTFVPRKNGGPGEGYLVILTVGPVADEVWIFAAGDLERGPLARLRHPQLDIGYSLHTTWLPDLPVSRSMAYRVERSDDYGLRVKDLAPKARALAAAILNL